MKNTVTAISEEVILWKHAGCLQMAEIKLNNSDKLMRKLNGEVFTHGEVSPAKASCC